MLSLLLDTGVIAMVVALMNGDSEVEWLKCVLVALGMSIVTAVCVGAGAAAGGSTGALVGILPATVLAGLIAWLALGLTFQRAMIVGAIFAAWKVAASFLFTALLS